MDGLSIIFNFGKWGGISLDWRGFWAKRICLGFVSIIFLPRDFETWLGEIILLIDKGGR